ncbi:MAG: hypothetical protein KGL03_13670 [Nitrospirota bacterium]|nr:hypothetical protein [Nitrospirota bacterium]
MYEGLISVLRKDNQNGQNGEAAESAPVAPTETTAVPDNEQGVQEQEVVESSASHLPAEPDTAQQEGLRSSLQSREEAVRAGLLVDVTVQAQALGLPLPVGITRALWNVAVATAHEVPEEQQAMRVRDILMALRLRLAVAQPLLPLFEFPALLALPPDSVPQICSLLALAHADQDSQQSLTLVLRNEVSAIITPFTN